MLTVDYIQNGRFGRFTPGPEITLEMLMGWQEGNIASGNYESITIKRFGVIYSTLEA